jgi:VWFA-related protein
MRAYVVAGLLVSSVALPHLDLGAAPSSSQDRPQRAPTAERASATAVVVDVVVRDGRGKPVVSLGADDFEIFEDGVRQTLGSFRAPSTASMPARADVERPQVPLPGARGAAVGGGSAGAAAKPVPQEPAVMAFVFDRLSLESRKLALDAVRKYVGDGPQTPNIIGVFDVNLSLDILQPFTQDAGAIRASLAKVSATRPGGSDVMHVTDLRGPTEQGLAGGPSGGRPADDLTVSMSDLTGDVVSAFGALQSDFGGSNTVQGVSAVVSGLSRGPGRKSILLFSEGIALSKSFDVRFYALVDQANRGNVAVYTVDAAGLRAGSHTLLAGRYAADAAGSAATTQTSPPDLGEIARRAPEVGLGILANETGGQRFDGTNDLFKAFPRVDEDLRSYFTLTYAPPRAEPDGKFHKIEVKVKRPGLSAKTRSGYTSLPVAAGSMPVLAYEATALARLDATPVPNELPVLARAFVFPVSPEAARVPVMVSLPARALDYAQDAAANTFAAEAVVLVRVRDAHGQVLHKASEHYAISGELSKIDASRQGELLFYRQPELASGVYTLEAIVQDQRSGKASVRVSSLEVSRASETDLRVGTPFVVQRAERVAEAQRDASNPLYFGDVLIYPNLGRPLSKDTDRELAFGFTAYDGHGTPLEASLELLRSGQSVATVPLALGAADRHGRINQISKLPLASLEPGSYELRVTVTAGTERVTRGVPFALSGR